MLPLPERSDIRSKISDAEFEKLVRIHGSIDTVRLRTGYTVDDISEEVVTPIKRPRARRPKYTLNGQAVLLSDRAIGLAGAIDSFSKAQFHHAFLDQNRADGQPGIDQSLYDFYERQGLDYMRTVIGAEAIKSAGYTDSEVEQIVKSASYSFKEARIRPTDRFLCPFKAND